MDIKIKRHSNITSVINPEGKKRRSNCKAILLGKPLGNCLEK